jgi:hypothetical protein
MTAGLDGKAELIVPKLTVDCTSAHAEERSLPVFVRRVGAVESRCACIPQGAQRGLPGGQDEHHAVCQPL